MIESDMAGWDRRPNGDIETEPVVSWAVGAMPLNVMVRLEILTESGQIAWAQIHISADQAIELGEALRLKGERALRPDQQGSA